MTSSEEAGAQGSSTAQGFAPQQLSPGTALSPSPEPERHSEHGWQLFEYGRERQRFLEEYRRSASMNSMAWGLATAFLLHLLLAALGMDSPLAFLCSLPFALLLTMLLGHISSQIMLPSVLARRDAAVEILRQQLFAGGMLYNFVEREERELEQALSRLPTQGLLPAPAKREISRQALLRRFEQFAFEELHAGFNLRQGVLSELSERQLSSAVRLAIHQELGSS